MAKSQTQSRGQKLAGAAREAAEVRGYQTDPDVVALQVERLRRTVERMIWSAILLGLAFTAINVQGFAAGNSKTGSLPWLAAWLLDPMVSLVVVAILLAESVTSRWQVKTGGWVRVAKWYSLGATYAMNTWQSWSKVIASHGTEGHELVVLHSVPPLLVLVAAEAAPILRARLTEAVLVAAQRSAERVAKSTEAVTNAQQFSPVSTKRPAAPAPGVERAPATGYPVERPAVIAHNGERSVAPAHNGERPAVTAHNGERPALSAHPTVSVPVSTLETEQPTVSVPVTNPRSATPALGDDAIPTTRPEPVRPDLHLVPPAGETSHTAPTPPTSTSPHTAHTRGTEPMSLVLSDQLSGDETTDETTDETAEAIGPEILMRLHWEREVAEGRVPTGADLARAGGVSSATGRRRRAEWAAELPANLPGGDRDAVPA